MLSNLNGLTQSEYNDLRWELILSFEEKNGVISWEPYIDSATIPQTTIGVGFNIEGNVALRDQVFSLMGLDDPLDNAIRLQIISAIDQGRFVDLHAK